MFKYFLLWFPMLLLAVINGTARDLWYKKFMSDLAAHQVSTISLIILFGVYIYLITKKFPPESGSRAIYIGLLWLMLTMLFEFGFGLFRGSSWLQLLGEYNIIKGRIWILIPTWISIAPFLFYKIAR